ncbi:MAG: molybdopterin-dependent oxidoreductase [Planctomycetota bacterium]|nr:molybdopterin-dependent oxidoreductase [Planctomycetota bacterium]
METKNLPSACPLDCPDHCSLDVTLEREAPTAPWRVATVDGDERNPLTAGAICGKVRAMGTRVHSTERITTPMRRVGGTKGPGSYPGDFEPMTWDAALELAAGRLAEVHREHGGEAILPVSYGGSNGALTDGVFDERLWRRLGAARLARTLCAAPGGAAAAGLVGKMPGVHLVDYQHAQLIVLWGVNPKESGMHLVQVLKRAVAAGAKTIVVDPRATSIARAADLHIAPRPGTDLCLALALIGCFFERDWVDADFLEQHTTGAEQLRKKARDWSLQRASAETGVPVADLERFAELFHAAEPAVVRLGWGVERNRNGGSACAAILALPLVAGKFNGPRGGRGGGFTASMSRALPIDREPAIGAAPVATREVNINHVGPALCAGDDGAQPIFGSDLTPPVRAAFVYNCNPASTLPNQAAVHRGLARADLFTVVSEQVATDTCHFADLVLPATTFLEHAELSSAYGTTYLTLARPALDPQGEARPNAVLFTELIRRLGLEQPGDLTSDSALAEQLIAGMDLGADQRRELDETGGCRSAHEHATGQPAVPFVDHFPLTTDGRAHLFPPALDAEARASGFGLYDYRPDPASERHPLTLLSPAIGRLTSSTFGESLEGQIPLVMHPEDAARRGLSGGDAVRIFNDLGEVHTILELRSAGLPGAAGRDAPRPGTCVLPKGLWGRHTQNGQTSNALCPDGLSDLGAGSTFNDARVEVEAL